MGAAAHVKHGHVARHYWRKCARHLRRVCSGVPEASTMAQSIGRYHISPEARQSRAWHRMRRLAAADALLLVARSAVRKRPENRTFSARARVADRGALGLAANTASTTTEWPCARIREAR